MNELGSELIKEMIKEEYETIIFNYLANNCFDLKDENIKEIVNLKCKQFESIYIENQQLKQLITKLKNQPTVYLTKYIDKFGFVETKTLNELIEELEKSDK